MSIIISITESGNPVVNVAEDVTTVLVNVDTEIIIGPSTGGGQVDSIVAGNDISVDATDPVNPIVSYIGTDGDMTKNVYDPRNIEADVYDMDNMTDGVTNKVFTSSLADDVEQNTLKVSFPEAPNDGQQYARQSEAWATVTAPSAPVDSVNGETGVVVLQEQDVDGKSAEDLTLTGAENISLATNADMYLKLTGNTTITFTDTPAVNTSIVRTYAVESSVAETLGIANSTDEFGTYANDTTINEMVVKASNYSTEGLIIRVFFSQPN